MKQKENMVPILMMTMGFLVSLLKLCFCVFDVRGLTLIVPGDSLKSSLLLKSEAYPIFLLLYPSSTAFR